MKDLSLHLLDIAGNATAAGATRIEISLREDLTADTLVLQVRDNGPGMDAEALARARNPFGTARTSRRVGLGIPLLEQAATEAGGRLDICSRPGEGTFVSATFQSSHINCKPLGDLAATTEALIAGNPETSFRIDFQTGGRHVEIDTERLQDELGYRPFHPAFLAAVRERLTGVRRPA